ncbi:TetR/AcrR family transcriptional regulator [Actinomadura sp. K4S16]|uniref:TetR/AcrR family transcriptional regulator n=1 Tax=Actinomadura sp. K4S16 TaxID=1316147 RepID=UPI0011ED0B90|nr:TetR/AcrR family transcriptional regulator [Actinomadura sp. K4S16]
MSSAAPGRRRRADAERNIARIVSAARECLGRDPGASIDDIAKAAGVGRMTLYGHFRNRADLVEAALVDALRAGEEKLSGLDLSGSPEEALTRLVESSWALVAESRALLMAAQEALPAGRVRELHADPAKRVEDIVRRGQDEGVFRTDLPITWLVNVVQYVLHGAAEETRAERLDEEETGRVVSATVRSILTT